MHAERAHAGRKCMFSCLCGQVIHSELHVGAATGVVRWGGYSGLPGQSA